MRDEGSIHAKLSDILTERNGLPRFDRTAQQEERFDYLLVQATILQWVLGIIE